MGGNGVSGPGVETSMSLTNITPEMAAGWLEGHSNYRSLVPSRVSRYANDMRSGNWKVTGDSIRFATDESGATVLVDGQHRLHACIESGVSFLAPVLMVDHSALPMIDTGKSRTATDEVRRRDLPFSSVSPRVATLLIAWRANRLSEVSRMRAETPTHVIVDYVEEHNGEIQHSIRQGERVGKAVGGKRSTWAAFVYRVTDLDPGDAERFVELLVTGANLDDDDPINALRRWSINRTINRVKTQDEEAIGVAVKAWNAWREGNPLKLVKFSTSGRGSTREKVQVPL